MPRRSRTRATRIRRTLTVVLLAALAGTALAPAVAAHNHHTILIVYPEVEYVSGDGDRGDGFCILQPVLAGIGQATCDRVNERYPCSGEEGSQARGGYDDVGVVLTPDGDGALFTCELAQNCINQPHLFTCIVWMVGHPDEWNEFIDRNHWRIQRMADDHAPD